MVMVPRPWLVLQRERRGERKERDGFERWFLAYIEDGVCSVVCFICFLFFIYLFFARIFG